MRFQNLDINLLQSRFAETGTGYSLSYKPEVLSTNDEALAAANASAKDMVFLTEIQSAGKGRRGRSWDVTDNSALTFSLLLHPHIPMQSLSMITLVMGMAVAYGIKQTAGLPVQIKWPNDIILEGKKVCGILTEANPELSAVVIGVGINVGRMDWPAELADKAISLEEGGWKTPSREILLCEVLSRFQKLFAKFQKSGDMTLLRKDYDNLLIHKNKPVRILAGKNSFDGTSQGIDKEGCLLVINRKNGMLRHVRAGEVSLQGVYGSD